MFGIARFLELQCDTQNIEFRMGGCLGMFWGDCKVSDCTVHGPARCSGMQGGWDCEVVGNGRCFGLQGVLVSMVIAIAKCWSCKVLGIAW